MATPIDQMLESVNWKPTEDSEDNTINGFPYATHSGVLELFGAMLRCYRLSTGHAVFDANDMYALFGKDIVQQVGGDPEQFRAP